MPTQIEVTVYKFEELSDKAKDHARYEHAGAFGYPWDTEALNSLKALATHFDGKLTDWSLDWFASSPSSAKFEMPEEMTREEITERLATLGTYNPETLQGLGDCVLTGYCMDENAIDGFRKAFLQGKNDLSALMQSAFKSWIKACHADMEYQYSDEGMTETCEANEYLFLKNGEFAPK